MTDELYGEIILDHYHHPRCCRPIDRVDSEVTVHNPLCGDDLTISIAVENGMVSQIRTVGRGCAISQASASIMSEYVKGKPIAEILQITPDEVMRILHLTLGPSRMKCALLSLEALTKVCAQYRIQNQGK